MDSGPGASRRPGMTARYGAADELDVIGMNPN
jgi:hypothetical protein